MMQAVGTNKKKATTKKTGTRPALQVEDDFDKTFRPDDSFDGVRVTVNESFGNKKESSNSEEWQIDLGAFNEGELHVLLSAMGPMTSDNNAKAGQEQAQLGVETDQSSAGSEDYDSDDFSWVQHGPAAADEDVEWEVLSTAESVISLSSDAAIVWTYKDALKLGKGGGSAAGKENQEKKRIATTSSSSKLQPIVVDIHLQSSCRAREKMNMNLHRSQEFDAEFVRDGVKLARGGCPARMFKGNPLIKKKK